MARDYAERAQWFLKEAEEALRSGKNAICIRRSQDALEFASKAVLRRLAIEYPHEHDVGEALRAAAETHALFSLYCFQHLKKNNCSLY